MNDPLLFTFIDLFVCFIDYLFICVLFFVCLFIKSRPTYQVEKS